MAKHSVGLNKLGSFLLFCMLFCSCAKENNRSFWDNSEEDTVYICKGIFSKSYHLDQHCKGLRLCTTEVFPVTLKSAKEMGREFCHFESQNQDNTKNH